MYRIYTSLYTVHELCIVYICIVYSYCMYSIYILYVYSTYTIVCVHNICIYTIVVFILYIQYMYMPCRLGAVSFLQQFFNLPIHVPVVHSNQQICSITSCLIKVQLLPVPGLQRLLLLHCFLHGHLLPLLLHNPMLRQPNDWPELRTDVPPTILHPPLQIFLVQFLRNLPQCLCEL